MTTPTTSWNTLRRDGYGVAYAVTIEGIPYVFAERQALVYDGTTPTVPSGYTFSGALAVMPGTTISSEADRKSGVGTGRAINLTLSRQRLVAEGIASALFARPSLRARVTADITNPATTTIDVDSTTGWGSTGSFWVGRERMTYTGTTATTFTGCTRGVVGYAHVVKSGLASGYSYATNTPIYWRGRLVTVYEHLLTPCGQMMGTAWATVGTYCRQIWLGFVDQQPQPAASGFVLRCLPIERLLAQKIGAEFTAEVVTGVNYPTGNYSGANAIEAFSPLIYAGESDQLFFKWSGSANVSVGPTRAMGITSIVGWFAEALATADATTGAWAQAIEYQPAAFYGAPALRLKILLAAADDIGQVSSSAWFAQDGVFLMVNGVGLLLPLNFNVCPAWLIVRPSSEALETLATFPSTGYGVIEVEGSKELVQWDQTVASTFGQELAIRIVARGIGGTPSLDPWTKGGTFRAVVGTQGLFEDVVRRMLTSSGTGARGSFDTLAFGFGLGIPDGLISAFPTYPFDSNFIDAINAGQETVENLIGGWLAIWNRCLVQRLESDGYVRLYPISTSCTDQANVADRTITNDDTTNTGTAALELQESPNAIEMKRGTMGSDRVLVVRDAARAQAEGPRTWSLRTPGISDEDGVRVATAFLAMSDGLAAFDVHLAPWVEVSMGEVVALTTAHPQAYDWDAGSWASGTIVGRVIGHERDLWTGAQKVVLLVAGQGPAFRYLAPSMQVVSVTTSTPLTIRVAPGEASKFFVAGDKTTIYDPGNEGSNATNKTISTITSAATYDEVVFTANGAGWESALSVVTFYDTYSTTTARQQSFMYVRADRDWL